MTLHRRATSLPFDLAVLTLLQLTLHTCTTTVGAFSLGPLPRTGRSWLSGTGSSGSLVARGVIADQNSQQGNGINFNPDGSAFLWVPQDEYSGTTFFDRWDFFSGQQDPTNGQVNFVDKATATANNLISFVNDSNINNGQPRVIMKADDTNTLPLGQFRNSVRISSQTQYQTGLFILDLNRAPWGCAVWPAFWTVGDNWPMNGEIDILEGVHDNEHNQIAWHTAPGCSLNPNAVFTGTVVNNGNGNVTNCDATMNSNSGCDVTEWSRASYGPLFEAQRGGVIAMKWDENGISVYSFFRAAIPADILASTPNPSLWGSPSATLDNTHCNITQYFANHSIVFDITFCGDWAGASYATSGCPGTCQERMVDPTNFVNATWDINSLKVYQKVNIVGGHIGTSSGAGKIFESWPMTSLIGAGLLGVLSLLVTVN